MNNTHADTLRISEILQNVALGQATLKQQSHSALSLSLSFSVLIIFLIISRKFEKCQNRLMALDVTVMYTHTCVCLVCVCVRDRESNKLSCDAWAIIKSETVTKKKYFTLNDKAHCIICVVSAFVQSINWSIDYNLH